VTPLLGGEKELHGLDRSSFRSTLVLTTSRAQLAVQLRRDVKPRLDEANVKLLLVSIGTPERGKDFARENDFPEQNLYADPENLCYDALELYGGVARTFFDVRTPFSMRDRFFKDGAKDLVEVLKRWKPWIPPKQSQTVLQGGVACFDGRECTFLHRDPSTGAHADWKSVLRTLGA